jgi:hypothetical protein
MQPERAFNLIRRFAYIPDTVELRETRLDMIAGVIAAVGLGVSFYDSPERLL